MRRYHCWMSKDGVKVLRCIGYATRPRVKSYHAAIGRGYRSTDKHAALIGYLQHVHSYSAIYLGDAQKVRPKWNHVQGAIRANSGHFLSTTLHCLLVWLPIIKASCGCSVMLFPCHEFRNRRGNGNKCRTACRNGMT